ncbi:CGNR zinc finger domain-containing protein [Arthrobacter sp. Leaf141]|uniref:CGNR zinc finger domain-containing protein n=1 Tax=Arthrobacter sp. Leaf141 TaxID=1736273 RepID=UPI001F3ECFD7|nr:CGNR zinc finger domain-containing protein [Arthrobacter sp. Leaf141]
MTGPLLAVDLVNLAAGTWTVEAAEEILRKHQIRRPAVASSTSQSLRDWAVRLRSAFEAADIGDRCRAINGLLDAGATRPYLSTHDQLRPHLHFAADDDDLLARVKAVTAGGLAVFAVESIGGRLGTCARDRCVIAFVDTSRNGLRSYCSARCGNNDAVQRHRKGLVRVEG